jgi:hypothetical protein
MKNQYFGDVNDYRKYGLLRCLAAGLDLRIGICWLLTAPDRRTDGELRRYLRQAHAWRGHDRVLFDRLSRLLDPQVTRSVHLARQWRLVPRARYFEPLLADDVRCRDAYFERARHVLRGCPLLFFDPDNGIEVRSLRRGRRHAAKYLYWTEIETAFAAGHSLLVYQHFPRVERGRYVGGLTRQLQDRLGTSQIVPYCTSRVVFLLALRPEHEAGLELANDLVRERWGTQMTIGVPAARKGR